MTRIFYITRANLDLRRAHVVNVSETAKALAQIGMPTEIVSQNIWRALFSRSHEYDVVYVRDHRLLGPAFCAKFFLGKKLIYEVHSTHSLLFLRRFLFTIADGAVFITKRLQAYYDPTGVKPAVVTHCNGIYPERLNIQALQASIRRELGLPQNGCLVLYAGSTRWYDIGLLIQMLVHLPISTSLILVGVKEEEMETLRPVIEKNNLTSRVVSVGRVAQEKIPLYLFIADILVNPLSADLPGSISSKLYEYLASGRPIVSSRGGANDEVLEDGKNALLADLTPESFAEAVQRLDKSPDLALRIGQAAREDSFSYTWERRARRIKELIETLPK